MMTAKEIAKNEGVTVRAINERWKANFHETPFDCNALLSPEQVELLSRKKAARVAKKSKAAPRTPAPVVLQPAPDYAQPAPETPGVPDTPPARQGWPTFHQVRRFMISALLFCVVILHGALIWYDCGALWGVPGIIGGGAVFAIVFAALLLASDATLPRTSGNALAFMFFVDCAAWKVHYEVFKTPVVENYITASLCAFICASSFVALWLFRDSKLD